MQKKLDPAYLEKTKHALLIHSQVDTTYPNLKDRDLRQYIYTIANRQFAEDFTDAVVIVQGIHENRKEEIENILKSLQFQNTTQVEVFFRDGQQLAAVYEVKKKNVDSN
jgi:hypothetical protein